MTKAIGRLITNKCRRPNCGHKWFGRMPNPPLCPKCHSPYWRTSKIRKKSKNDAIADKENG